MIEKITIGNPSELFRELEIIFKEKLGIEITSSEEPKLIESLAGVASFKGELHSLQEIKSSFSRTRSVGAGTALVVMAAIFILIVVIFFPAFPLWLILLAGAALFAGVAAYAFSSETIGYTCSGKILFSIKGEAYHGLAIGPNGQRSSIFSRATISTSLSPMTNPVYDDCLKFAGKLETLKLKLDDEIRLILPDLEMKKVELPDTKT